MAWLVLLGSGFLLVSVTTLDQFWLQLGLVLFFLLTGWLFYKQKVASYLAFLFLYPLLPSQTPQLSSFDFLEFVFLCFAFWWGLSKIVSKRSGFPSTALNRPLALMMMIFALSMFLSMLRHNYIFSEVFLLKLRDNWNIVHSTSGSDFIALRSLIYAFEGIIFFFITVDVLDSLRIQKSVRMIVYSAVLVSVVGILQYFLKFGLLEYWIIENPNITRINSSFSDPNSLGTYLASVFCLAVFTFVAGESKQRRYDAGLAIIILIALIFTASRAAWTATFLTLLIAPAAGKLFGIDPFQHLTGIGGWLARRGVVIAICGLLLLFGAATLMNYSSPQPDSLVKMLLFTFNLNLSPDEILKGRIEFWKTAVSVFQDYPIFGSGPGSFRFLANAPYFVTTPENAHNYFLQILAETGLPGFLLFCLILLLVFRETRKRLRTASKSDFLLQYGILAGLIAFLLTSLTGHPLLLLKLQLLFWSIIGLLIVRHHPLSVVEGSRGHYGRLTIISGILLCIPFFLQLNEILKTRRLSVYEYGYHPWERDEQGFLFRWTRLNALSVLDVNGEVLSFRLRQFNPEVRKKPASLKLYLNNELLDTIHFSDTNWKALKYFVPHVANHHRITLRIVAESPFEPEDHRDQRELGVGIQNFAWECSSQTPIGVHEEEREEEKTYYWTRGQASFLLNRPGTALSFRILPNILAETEPVDVQFYWNHQEIGRRTLTGSDWESVKLQIPGGGGSSGVLTVRVSRTANLKQMNRGEDLRDLGVRMELPFQWHGTLTIPPKRIEHLSNPTLYGVSNHANRPIRLLLFPGNQYFSSNFKVSLYERALQRQQGLFNLVTPKEGGWVRIYPDKPFQRFVETFVWQKIEKSVELPSGSLLIRMKAIGSTEGGDVPIVSLRIDDREVARQPIVYGGWTNYFFPVELPNGGKKIVVEFLNDYYLPDPKIDRNLMIAELAIAKAQPLVRMREGWEVVEDGLLVAESLDRNFPFLPWGRCYTIETEK